MTVVPLAALMPGTPPGQTVSLEDATLLERDLMLYGNAFVQPAYHGEATHERIPPTTIRPSTILEQQERVAATARELGVAVARSLGIYWLLDRLARWLGPR